MTQRLPAIDGLRGLAMLVVLIQHLFGRSPGWMPLHIGELTVFPIPFFSNGFHALGLFFMLSGFVIYLPYASGKRTMRGAKDVFRYLHRRSLRLLPLLVGSSLIIAAGYHLASGTPLIADFLTMLRQTVLHEVDYPLHNNVLWSLRTELWFCAVFPLVVMCGARFGMRRTALALCVFALGVKMLSVYLTPELGPKLLRDSALGRVDDFALGMLMAEALSVSRDQLRSRWTLPGIALLLGVAFQITDLSRSGIVTAYADPFAYLLASLSFACLIGIASVNGSTILNRFLSLKPFTYLGTVSYSVYIWHVPLMNVISPGQSILHLAAYLVLVLGTAELSYRVLEKPFMRRRNVTRPSYGSTEVVHRLKQAYTERIARSLGET
jgi:peptidoglycan/LPS O-acetylase OafA/YrhL